MTKNRQSEDNLRKMDISRFLNHMKDHAAQFTNQPEVSGFQIAALIRLLSNQYENIFEHHAGEDELSGPRMSILARLMESEKRGKAGITPTELSHNQHVSRNTISALLRGLEEQKLIQRELDPDDRRLFRIHITAAGHKLVQTMAPQRIAMANQIVSGLSPEEQAQLVTLLSKLFVSLQNHCHCPEGETGPGPDISNLD